MKVTLEQISEIRRELKNAKRSLATYNDYLGQKEKTSTDYSGCGLIGDSVIDAQYHKERDDLEKLYYILTNAEYVTDRQTDEIGIGTKFFMRFNDDTETKALILTEFVQGISYGSNFVSIESPLGQAVIGKKTGEGFSYQVVVGNGPRDRYNISGQIEGIVTEPKDYLQFISSRPLKNRISKEAKRERHELLTANTEEAQEENARRHEITDSQVQLLFLEKQKVGKHSRDKKDLKRLSEIEKVLQTSKVATPPTDGTIGIGSTFEIVVSDGQNVETRRLELINRAVTTELEDAYVERIDALGSKLFGKRQDDIIKFKKDNKTYSAAVVSVDVPEITVAKQYRK